MSCLSRLSFLFICLVAFCSFKDPLYCKLSRKIVREVSKELNRDKNLRLLASGGAMMHDIKKVTIEYLAYDPCSSVAQARELYIEISEEYLKRYNSNEKIRPFLHDYPFTIKNLDLGLVYVDKKNQSPPIGYVAFVFSTNNKIYYSTYDSENDFIIRLHEEPYDEAVRIVRENLACR